MMGIFYNTDVLVMSVAEAGLASVCYGVLLPPRVAVAAISSTRSSCIQRWCEAHTILLCAGSVSLAILDRIARFGINFMLTESRCH